MKYQRVLRLARIIAAWAGTAFFLVLALAFLPSWSSLFGLLAVVLLLPPLALLRARYLQGWMRIAPLLLCAVLSFALAPVKNEGSAEQTPQAMEVTAQQTPTAIAIPAPTAAPTRVPAALPAPTRAAKSTPAPTLLPTPVPTLLPTPTQDAQSTRAALPEAETLTVRFIDVGQGSAALLRCGGETLLLDGGGSKSSSHIYSLLRAEGIEHIDYIVSTHAHEDHVGGLSGALNACTVGRIFCGVREYDSDAFRDFQKYAAKRGVPLEIPTTGYEFSLGSARVRLLGPLADYSDHNDASLVLRVTHGACSFLFMGDANNDSEKDLLRSGAALESTVLQVGHHGSEDATSYAFLRAAAPRCAVVSAGLDNRYGHPTETVLSRLHDADATVYRTDLQGDVLCESDGREVTFATEKQAREDELMLSGDALISKRNREAAPKTTQAPERTAQNDPIVEGGCAYIGNVNSKKFHRPSCNSLPAQKNRACLASREQAIAEGYAPCKRCDP